MMPMHGKMQGQATRDWHRSFRYIYPHKQDKRIKLSGPELLQVLMCCVELSKTGVIATKYLSIAKMLLQSCRKIHALSVSLVADLVNAS